MNNHGAQRNLTSSLRLHYVATHWSQFLANVLGKSGHKLRTNALSISRNIIFSRLCKHSAEETRHSVGFQDSRFVDLLPKGSADDKNPSVVPKSNPNEVDNCVLQWSKLKNAEMHTALPFFILSFIPPFSGPEN